MSLRRVLLATTLGASVAVAVSCKPPHARHPETKPRSTAVPALLTTRELEEWTSLLQRGLSRRAEDREHIQAATASKANRWVAALASVLLEEWELDSESLRFPRPVLPMEALRLEEGKSTVTSAMVVAEAVVGSDGLVSTTSLVKSSGDTRIDTQVLERLRRMLFRPARRSYSYKSETYVAILRLNFGP